MILVHGQQILGQRDRQEDSFSIIRQNDQDPSSDILMLLADGMGGHSGGEIASALAIETFGRHFVGGAKANRPLERLQESLQAANTAMQAALACDAALRGMGCTMIGAIKNANNLHWVSVGDSVIYLLRRGEINRLNADHSVFGELMERVERGKLTRAEALAHPRRNALRSALMGQAISLVDARSILLEPDDVVVIASDGIDTLSPSEVSALLLQMPRAPRDAAAALLEAIERRKSPVQDNTTVIVYWHSDGTPSAFFRDSKWSLVPPRVGSGLLKAALVAVFVAAAAGLVFFFMSPAPVPKFAPVAVAPDTISPRRGAAIVDTTRHAASEKKPPTATGPEPDAESPAAEGDGTGASEGGLVRITDDPQAKGIDEPVPIRAPSAD